MYHWLLGSPVLLSKDPKDLFYFNESVRYLLIQEK